MSYLAQASQPCIQHRSNLKPSHPIIHAAKWLLEAKVCAHTSKSSLRECGFVRDGTFAAVRI